MEKHDVQRWKALLWGVPFLATKNASDWQRSSKRLITLGLLIFLPFLMISRDRFWIFLARSQKLLLNARVRTMLCNSFIYFLYIVCLCILYYSIVFYSSIFLGTLSVFQIYPCTRPVPEPRHRRYFSLRRCLNTFCGLLLRSGLPNVVEVQPVFADMSIPFHSVDMYVYMFRCVPGIFQHDHCVASFAFLCMKDDVELKKNLENVNHC